MLATLVIVLVQSIVFGTSKATVNVSGVVVSSVPASQIILGTMSLLSFSSHVPPGAVI